MKAVWQRYEGGEWGRQALLLFQIEPAALRLLDDFMPALLDLGVHVSPGDARGPEMRALMSLGLIEVRDGVAFGNSEALRTLIAGHRLGLVDKVVA